MPRINRRRFLTASAAAAAGLSAAGCTASGAAAASAAPRSLSQSGNSLGRSGHSLTEAILTAFRTSRVVGLAEAHQLQEHHDLLQTLISDPRLPGMVDDIVVEFGNGLYQDTIDAFVLDGQPVADADLRLVWRNTSESPVMTWDAPVYEQFFRRVRAVNWTLPPEKRIRVLLGDPPIDWSKVTSRSQIPFGQRDTHAASVVEQQVLARGRRALLCYGDEHLQHTNGVSGSAERALVPLIEHQTGVRTFVIADLIPLQGDPGGLGAKLSSYPRGTVIPATGTSLGQFNAGYAISGLKNVSTGQVVSQFCGTPLGKVVDAGLYLGQPADLTVSWPTPAIFLDPAYWAELQRRNALQGIPVDLDTYRQEHPPGYPAASAPTC
ncbi:MAG TPA: hypothetical protein VIY52_25890 [Streptosporangiaceae bacterium]